MAAQAKLGLVRTAFAQKKQPSQENINELIQILNWPEAGREKDGFMDLAFEALVSLMRAYLADDPATARQRFNSELPWQTINKYKDLKRAMDLETVDLARLPDKWPQILAGLAVVQLPNDRTKTGLVIVRDMSQEME